MTTPLNPNMPANGMLNPATPNHHLQPQGVGLAIPLGTALFYPVEFVEDGQITLPNFVTVIGKANAGTATLVINDGLLRTHLDSMVFAVNNTGGGDVILHLAIAKKPVTDYTHALSDDYFSQTITTTIKADEHRHLELRHVAGQYVIADRNLTVPSPANEPQPDLQHEVQTPTAPSAT